MLIDSISCKKYFIASEEKTGKLIKKFVGMGIREKPGIAMGDFNFIRQ